MFEATGHFLVYRGAPHLVLTAMPATLRAHFESQAQAALAALNVSPVSDASGEALSHDDVARLPSAIAESAGWGDWSLPTATGEVHVQGQLLSLAGLGLHGRRGAEQHAKASSERVLEEGAHAVRVGPQGDVLGWAITPRALKH